VRVAAAIVTFVVVGLLAIVVSDAFTTPPDPETFVNQAGANAFALALGLAFVAAVVVYMVVEYAQTRRLDSITRQFTTRTLVLMPLAIALNVVLGQAVASALKVPIYLDSIGTILVGVLCGPIAGALTGFLANVLWSYVIPPPFQYGPAAAFAVVAAVIGLLAGIFARAGWLKPRPDSSDESLWLSGAVVIENILVLALLAYLGYRTILGEGSLLPSSTDQLFVVLGGVAILVVLAAVVGVIAILIRRRDRTAAYVVLAGVITGIVAAVISAPIAANVFGGVTASGTDFLVAAFRQAGADLGAATLGQGLISDPIDKVTTFSIVYVILGAMAVRSRASFPQGEYLIADEPEEVPPVLAEATR
jgi:hypothetical protein